jgi:hypothetical protein
MERPQKRASSFVVFLVLSTCFWFLIKLSKEYTSTVNYTISYINIPENKIVQNSSKRKIPVVVKASGYRLIKQVLFDNKLNVNAANLKAEDNTGLYSISLADQLPYMAAQHPSVKFEAIVKDTLLLDIGKLDSKVVPVVLSQNIQFKPGYHHDGIYILNPDSIRLTGPETQIRNILSIETQELNLQEVMDSLDIEVNLDFSPYLGQNLKWSADKVGIIAAVEKYTEGSFEVPVLIRNIPDSLEIKIFPKKVSVFYQTGLSKFNQVSSSDFVLSADFNKSMELGINYMDVEIEQKSKLVRFVRINPVKLEFLTSVK